MILLALDELLHVAERTPGAPPVIRDGGLLESAVARPRATVLGADVYLTLEMKVAALVHSVVRNRALVDVNKRLGLAALLVTSGINGRRLTGSNDEAYDSIIDIAEGNLEDVTVIAERIVRGLEESRLDRWRSSRDLQSIGASILWKSTSIVEP